MGRLRDTLEVNEVGSSSCDLYLSDTKKLADTNNVYLMKAALDTKAGAISHDMALSGDEYEQGKAILISTVVN